jgi:hypothetical protein
MNVEHMRAQMIEALGSTPIPEASLAQYAATVAGLSDAISVVAARLSPEDDVAGFSRYLEGFAEGRTDVS